MKGVSVIAVHPNHRHELGADALGWVYTGYEDEIGIRRS